MKTLAALIFCISLILLMVLSGANNKEERFITTKVPVEIFETVECLEECLDRILVTVVPADAKAKVLVGYKGQSRTVMRIEYQGEAGWFTYTEEKAELIGIK